MIFLIILFPPSRFWLDYPLLELRLLGEQSSNLRLAPRFQRGGARVSETVDLTKESKHILLVRHVHDRHEVVFAHGVVELHLPPQPLKDSSSILRFRLTLHLPQALVSIVAEYDIVIHFLFGSPPSS